MLYNQFDLLCDTVFEIVHPKDVDIEGGIARLRKITPISEKVVRKLLTDIKKVQVKAKHQTYAKLVENKWTKEKGEKELDLKRKNSLKKVQDKNSLNTI